MMFRSGMLNLVDIAILSLNKTLRILNFLKFSLEIFRIITFNFWCLSPDMVIWFVAHTSAIFFVQYE